MSGLGTDRTKEIEGGDSSAFHTFSINATPFEPSGNTSSFVQDAPPEESPTMGSGAQWAFPSPFYNMMFNANMSVMAQMNALLTGGAQRYSGTPIVRASSPNIKNSNSNEISKKIDKNSLSVHAKPWTPHPESALNNSEINDTCTQLIKGWTKVMYRGDSVVAPVPFKETNSLFVHSLEVSPLEKPKLKFELFNYMCARCPTKSFFGKLSCRGPDVTLKWVAGDIPPLRIAHLIEQVTGAAVCALCAGTDNQEYELWLEKPDKAAYLVSALSGALWTCPMFHGYAVYAKKDDEKTFLQEYISGLKDSFPEETPYPMCCVEAFVSPPAL